MEPQLGAYIYSLLVKYSPLFVCLFVWFDSLLPINNFSVKQGRVFLGWTSTKLGKCVLLKDHNAVTPVRLEPPASRSQVKHFTTEPLRSLFTLDSAVNCLAPTEAFLCIQCITTEKQWNQIYLLWWNKENFLWPTANLFLKQLVEP